MAADLDAVWWDPAATLDAVLWQLRLGGGDIDAERIASCIPPAGRAITAYIDPLVNLPGPPTSLQNVLEAVTIAIYHRDEVGATVGGSVSNLRPGGTAPFDPVADVAAELDNYVEQWGTA